MFPRFILVLAPVFIVTACQSAGPPPDTGEPEESASTTEDFAAPIARAHSADVWHGKGAFQSGIVVRFGGNQILEGRMLTTPSMSRTRIELASGAVAIWDGEEVWVSPGGAEFPEARFHALTWPYFLSAPMKLRDAGARLEPLGSKELRGEAFETARLTFDAGVGDTPDDWYVLYRNPESGRLAAMAYIVTFGTSREEAEKEPHAITYDEFVDVEGVPIPTRWTFWMWSEEAGIHGDPIGDVVLENPSFVAPEASAFGVPEDARKEEMPQPTGS
jgi:hypothetical protein